MRISFELNGRPVTAEPGVDETLLALLRRLGATGVKEGCGVGECGACTVIVDGMAVDSCLYPACKANGTKVTTIEGLANGGKLHPIQEAFVESGAVQCGYCTPGMILSAKALLDRDPAPSKAAVAEALEGNLCRCTGYQDILAAVRLAAEKMGDKS